MILKLFLLILILIVAITLSKRNIYEKIVGGNISKGGFVKTVVYVSCMSAKEAHSMVSKAISGKSSVLHIKQNDPSLKKKIKDSKKNIIIVSGDSLTDNDFDRPDLHIHISPIEHKDSAEVYQNRDEIIKAYPGNDWDKYWKTLSNSSITTIVKNEKELKKIIDSLIIIASDN